MLIQCFYTYAGGGVSESDVYDTLSELLNKVKSTEKWEIGVTTSALSVFGDEKFIDPKQYEGLFTTVSTGGAGTKTSASLGNHCFSIAGGSSRSFGINNTVSLSASTYTLKSCLYFPLSKGGGGINTKIAMLF